MKSTSYTTCNLAMPPPADTTFPCFILTIQESTFEDFGLMKTTATSATFVDSAYKMQYYGSILDVDNFPGHIFIYGSTFTNNILKY